MKKVLIFGDNAHTILNNITEFREFSINRLEIYNNIIKVTIDYRKKQTKLININETSKVSRNSWSKIYSKCDLCFFFFVDDDPKIFEVNLSELLLLLKGNYFVKTRFRIVMHEKINCEEIFKYFSEVFKITEGTNLDCLMQLLNREFPDMIVTYIMLQYGKTSDLNYVIAEEFEKYHKYHKYDTIVTPRQKPTILGKIMEVFKSPTPTHKSNVMSPRSQESSPRNLLSVKRKSNSNEEISFRSKIGSKKF